MAKSVRSFRVMDQRQKPFLTVDKRLVTEVMGTVSSHALVLFLLLLHQEEEGGGLRYDRIAVRMAVPLKTVQEAVGELVRTGLLEAEEDGGWTLGIPDREASHA